MVSICLKRSKFVKGLRSKGKENLSDVVSAWVANRQNFAIDNSNKMDINK